MNISPAKENILKKIRKALTQSTPIPFPGSEGTSSIYQPILQEPEIEFAEQFSRLMGRFSYCSGEEELAMQLSALIAQEKWTKIYCQEKSAVSGLPQALISSFNYNGLADCDVAITGCECLIARTGSIMMSAGQQSGRTTSVYAPIHVCIAYTSQLVEDIKDGLNLIKQKYGSKIPSLITFATGPSRTADIEKTLVVGVHGPKEVYVFLVEATGGKFHDK